ncbi:MAG: phosphoglucomutase/phosphomannomutase family protein [Dehalococcoidales bacterium]
MKFGTDGWRGIIGDDFTFANVKICGQAVSNYIKETGLSENGVVIGYDTRFASEDFAAAAAEVLAGNGIRVLLCTGATPTPALSFCTLFRQAAGGIMITASHNPAQWNGFKVKNRYGSSASPEVTNRIETEIDRIMSTGNINRIPLVKAQRQELLEYMDAEEIYFKQISELVNIGEIRKSSMKIVVDPMYGAGAGYFKKLLSGGNVEIIEINSERNPIFPGIKQPEPIETNLAKLSETVVSKRASVGLATDGDADRLGVIDENGSFISTSHIFALLCLYLLEVRGKRGPIVKTLTISRMLDLLGDMYDVPVYETAVGFKYIAPKMQSEHALIGGEESGGYGFREHVIERDGIVAGLYLLDFMVKTGRSPSDLIGYLQSKVGAHYYRRIDLQFPEDSRQSIIDRVRKYSPITLDDINVASKDAMDGFRFMLSDASWLLIRFSSTEPLLRLYAESGSLERVEKLLETARELVGKEMEQ